MAQPVREKKLYHIYAVFIGILILNIGFWIHARTIIPRWDNVPPAPKTSTISFSGLGDPQIAYRLTGYILQNLGNTGGNSTPLKAYDYKALKDWFFAASALDHNANYIEFLAAYYFGAVDDSPDKIAQVVDYLAVAGAEPYPQKWRWLAHAVYLARYKEQNIEKALALAYKLAALKTDTAPWARQMPAFVQLQMGNKEASYEIMIRMLASEAEKLDPVEVNYMKDFICTRALDKIAAAQNPLCQTSP